MAKNISKSMHIFRYFNSVQNVSKRWPACVSQVRYGSALYVSGREANKNFSFLTPYVNLDNRFNDVEKLQQELRARAIDIDAKEMKKSWEFVKSIFAQKIILDHKKVEITNQVKKLIKKTDKTPQEEQELNRLKIIGNIVKTDLKMVKDTVSELEETIIPTILKLPNTLDPNTPVETPVVLKETGTLHMTPEDSVQSHLEIGKNLGLLKYINQIQYYLHDEAALFELGVVNYAGKILAENNMLRVAGSDFSRSIVVEGSGLNHEDPMDAFTLQNNEEIERNSPNRMHIVGSASLVSFLAMHTKQLINPKSFPLKYFATGRQYVPLRDNVSPLGLFTACQAVVAHIFLIIKDVNNEQKVQLDEILQIICKLYDGICEHYRVVVRPASELLPSESMRISFEMWSQHLRNYVEIGHISTYNKYLSERLLIAYQTSTGRDYPAIISGTVLSVPRLLGCLLEQNPDKFEVPKKIVEYMPVNLCGANEL